MAEDREELLALGAAGALTPEETAELESLLATDPSVAAEFAAMLDDVTVLAESVAERPPEQLRASVMAAIAAEPAATDPVAAEPTAAPVPAPAPPPAPAPAEHVAPVVPIHRRRWWIPATAVAAAIVVVVGALIVTRDAEAPTTSDVMAAVLEDDDAVTVELTGSPGELRLVTSEEHDATVLVGDDIAAPDPQHVLQLWAIEDSQPASMGTFVPDADGHVAVVMEGTEPEGALYAVTVEPEGGSEQPTSEPIYGPA
jgi:anti-sigma-K factor RskA